MVGILVAMLLRHELLGARPPRWRVAGPIGSVLRRVGARSEVQLAGRRHGALWRILGAASRA